MFGNRGSQKGGRGGGGPKFGGNSQKIPFFFWVASLIVTNYVLGMKLLKALKLLNFVTKPSGPNDSSIGYTLHIYDINV